MRHDTTRAPLYLGLATIGAAALALGTLSPTVSRAQAEGCGPGEGKVCYMSERCTQFNPNNPAECLTWTKSYRYYAKF